MLSSWKLYSIGLHIPAGEHLEAHRGEDLVDLAQGLVAGVQPPQLRPPAGQSDVHAFGGHFGGQGCLGHSLLAFLKGRRQLLLEHVGGLAKGWSLVGRQIRNTPQQLQHRALAAQVLDTPRLQCIAIAGFSQVAERFVSKCLQVLHRHTSGRIVNCEL